MFCVLTVICTFCAQNILYTYLYFLMPPYCFGLCFVASFPYPTHRNFYRSEERPHPPQATDGGFHSAAPCFCHQVASLLSGRRSRGLNYKGKMYRQHTKQFNIHTQPLLLVRRAFFLTTSVFRSPATPTQLYIGKSWTVKSL